MSDLISRQAAIDAITDELMPSTPLSAVIRAKNRLKGLPPAQPEERTEKRTETHACDLISRQAAIGEVKKHYRAYDNDLLELIIFDIERLPPAHPEEAIPVSWIESRIERFKAEDNAFCGLTANIMHVMLNEWKREQEDDNETGRIHGSGI